MTDCCAADWRVELLDIRTGGRVGYLTPLTFNFETLLNEVGTGSVTVPVRSVTPDMVWPHHRMVAFLRIAGPGASPTQPACEFIGIIEEISAESDGACTIALKSIESYLQSRLVRQNKTYTAEPQNELAADLVNSQLALTTTNAPLSAKGAGGTLRDRTYLQKDYKIILEALLELTKIRNGPDYLLRYEPTGTGWQAIIAFSGHVGSTDDSKQLNSARGLQSFSLSVDGQNHTNQVHGIGANPNLSHVAGDNLGDGLYPRMMRSEQYSDVKRLTTVQNHAEGSLDNDLHPRAQPSVAVAGLELAVPIGIGDRVNLTLDQGVLRYKGPARVVGKAWSVSTSAPTLATFSFVPGSASVDAILNVAGSDDGCCG